MHPTTRLRLHRSQDAGATGRWRRWLRDSKTARWVRLRPVHRECALEEPGGRVNRELAGFLALPEGCEVPAERLGAVDPQRRGIFTHTDSASASTFQDASLLRREMVETRQGALAEQLSVKFLRRGAGCGSQLVSELLPQPLVDLQCLGGVVASGQCLHQ
jgi:hypothetical protein